MYWTPCLARSLLFFVVDSVCLSVCMYVCLFVRLYVCLSVCHGQTSNRFFFFVSRWNRAIFWSSFLHVALYKALFFNFWFRPPNSQNLLPNIWQKISYNSACMTDRPRCLGLLGVFRDGRFNGSIQNVVGWPLLPWQRNFGKFGLLFHKVAYKSSCMPDTPYMFGPTRGADPCCHGNEIWARSGDINAYRLVVLMFCPVFLLLQGFHQYQFPARTHSPSTSGISQPGCSSKPWRSSRHPPSAGRGCSSHRGYPTRSFQDSCAWCGVWSRTGRDPWATAYNRVTTGGRT